MKARIVILASGDGSNFQALTEATRTHQLSAEVVGLITNKEGVRALERAKALNVPAQVFVRRQFPSSDAWNAAMAQQLREWNADWIVLAGFTGLIGSALLASFPNRFVNSHPSLLPKFGGKGMYGNHVHRAVVEAKESVSGISVHLLNEKFDEGPILQQKIVPVLAGDTAETLAERIKTEERKFFPRVLEDLLTGRIKTR